jgi:hypothetical protein
VLLTPINTIEDVRQALFGYRRDDKGEIIEASPMWDPGSREAKEVMEQARQAMFGYCRNLQGKVVGTVEEALQGTEVSQPSQDPGSHQRLQSVIGDLAVLSAQADRLTRSIRGLRD